jgi:hypothetical protein
VKANRIGLQGGPHRLLRLAAIGGAFVVLPLTVCGVPSAQPLQWMATGPGPNTQGQVENILDREVVGAINTVAPHPTDASIVYVGAVNGGIWKTTTAMAASPSWTPQTDSSKALSIGALEFDPADTTHQTLVAGTGRFSSFYRRGGPRVGLLRTTDGGASWTPIDGGGTLVGLNITGVAARGSIIVLAANTADNPANQGVWRSTDTGATWTQLSGAAGTGLPAGASFDLASDPSDPARLFTNAGGNGLYRSTDGGASWSKVSDAAMDGLIAGAGNVDIAVGTSSNVYVVIVRMGRLAGVFRSGNGGGGWTAMDMPMAADGGIHPGGQGNIHLSVAADPSNANIVYIGGDRQDFPNSIGALDYSGRLVRGDASQPSGSQFVHLTHSSALGPAGGGTASSSAPHADSRDMDVATNGVLIEVDDGGIYRRSDPRTDAGDWFSMNGDLQSTEFHAVAWDANAGIVIGGAQDTGTPEQQLPANVRWRSVSTADGGVVAVDDSSTPGLSVRYSSNQSLGGFRRRVYNAANVLQSQTFPTLTVIGGGAALLRQFYTPVVVNAVMPTRLVIGGANSVYESLDQGNTIREVGPGIQANGDFGRDPIAYGASGNPDILYVGSGTQVFIRSAAHPATLVASPTYPGGQVVGIAIDPGNAQTAFVIDSVGVFRTTDAGATWTNISGNLGTLAPGALTSIAYAAGPQGGVVVGSETGVFRAAGPTFTTWGQLGTALPRAPVLHLEYDAADTLLLAGTLGRGAWTLGLGAPPLAVALPWLRALMD